MSATVPPPSYAHPHPHPDVPHLVQVLPDVWQVQLPLPFALRIVNCYLLRGETGWTILDTGLNTPDGRAAWDAVFTALAIGPGDVARIVVSHIHPDHYGMAGWLQARLSLSTRPVPVCMSPRSVEQVAQVWSAHPDQDQAQAIFFQRCGLAADAAQIAVGEMGRMRAAIHPQPRPGTVEILTPGTLARLGGRAVQVIHAPGHSDGQIIFYDPAARMMLCADQVLMRISPNISIWPSTEPSPLRRYLDSLAELAQLDVALALPGHRALIHDWQGRLGEIAHHHQERLDEMYHATGADSIRTDSPGAGSTVADVSARIFDHGRLSNHEIRFAITETLAHLDFLVESGRLIQDVDESGVMRFSHA